MTQENQAIYQQLQRCINRKLDWKLFGTSEIYGLDEMSQYVSFLDKVSSLEDLVRGLTELSPFADDALVVVKSMGESDFCTFKLALPSEHRGDERKLPERFGNILLPDRFIQAIILSEKAGAPLGATLVRILEGELGG